VSKVVLYKTLIDLLRILNVGTSTKLCRRYLTEVNVATDEFEAVEVNVSFRLARQFM